MIRANARLGLICHSQVLPSKGRFVNIKTPDIVNGLSASIAAEDEKIGLAEDKRVAVAPAGGSTDDGNDHPLCSSIAIAQVK